MPSKPIFIVYILVVLILMGCAHKNKISETATQTPLPKDVKIISPSADVPKEIAAFSGVWVGVWEGGGYRSPATLVVETISSNKLSVIYSWGKWKKQKPAFDFPPAGLSLGEKPKIKWRYGKTDLIFELGSEKNTIKGMRITPKSRSTIVLHKKNEALFRVETISHTPAETTVIKAIKSGMATSLPASVIPMRIEIDPKQAYYDEPISIRLSGFNPNQKVTLRAWSKDDDDELWESHATFGTDSHGSIDVMSQAPISGTYDDIDGMGLFWSMRKYEYERVGSFFSKKDTRPIDVVITAEVEGNLVASTVFQRLISAPNLEETLVIDEGLVGTFFKPIGAGPFPGIILVSGSGGGELLSPWARLLASRYGYATFSLAYTNAENLPRHLVNIPLEYFENAIHWMQSKNEVRADRIAVIGHSRGGELALLLGATFPQIKAIVAYSPSSVIWGGYDGKTRKEQSSWSLEGKPLPFVSNKVSRAKRYELWKIPYESLPIFLLNLKNQNASDKAAIHVEKINGPILLVSGVDDKIWPSTMMSDMIVKRLKKHNFHHSCKHLSYTNSGHNQGIPYGSTTALTFRHPTSGTIFTLGGTAKGNAFAKSDSWPQVIDFLKKNIKD